MIRSIQGRIVLGSIGIAAGVLLILGAVVGEQLRTIAGTSIVTLANEELRPFAAELRAQPDEPPDAPAPGTLVLIVSPEGETVIDTMPPGLAGPVRASGTGVSRLHAGGGSYVAVGQEVTNSRGVWRIWALRSSEAATNTAQGFARVLLQAVAVVLLLVVLGSWVLVRTSLRPVRRLRTAADEIQRSGGDGRLPEGRGRDELAALAATLNRLLDGQRASVERERRMVADASHELRTPLAVLTMRLEVGQQDADDADALRRTLAAAQAQARALSRLTTQLLELAQLDSDASDRRRDGAAVGALISEAMAGVDRARTVAPHEVRVEFDVDDALPEDAETRLDVTAFGRIIDNLISNALRATTAGAVEVRLGGTADRLVLAVADSGTGVEAEFLPHAFDRFARSDESRAAGAEGSGLGLALVRALVLDAGGTVSLANRSAGGAIAVAELPVSGAQPSAPAVPI